MKNISKKKHSYHRWGNDGCIFCGLRKQGKGYVDLNGNRMKHVNECNRDILQDKIDEISETANNLLDSANASSRLKIEIKHSTDGNSILLLTRIPLDEYLKDTIED